MTAENSLKSSDDGHPLWEKRLAGLARSFGAAIGGPSRDGIVIATEARSGQAGRAWNLPSQWRFSWLTRKVGARVALQALSSMRLF